MNLTIKKRQIAIINRILLLIVFLFCCSNTTNGQGSIAKVRIPFKGTATGGTLIICDGQDPHNVQIQAVTINTSPGESAESVVKHLSKEIAYSDSLFWEIWGHHTNLLTRDINSCNVPLWRD